MKKQRELLILSETVCSPARGMRGQAFPFYTDCISIVIPMKTRGKLNGEATSREIETNRI